MVAVTVGVPVGIEPQSCGGADLQQRQRLRERGKYRQQQCAPPGLVGLRGTGTQPRLDGRPVRHREVMKGGRIIHRAAQETYDAQKQIRLPFRRRHRIQQCQDLLVTGRPPATNARTSAISHEPRVRRTRRTSMRSSLRDNRTATHTHAAMRLSVQRPKCAEPDDRCADTHTADTVARRSYSVPFSEKETATRYERVRQGRRLPGAARTPRGGRVSRSDNAAVPGVPLPCRPNRITVCMGQWAAATRGRWPVATGQVAVPPLPAVHRAARGICR